MHKIAKSALGIMGLGAALAAAEPVVAARHYRTQPRDPVVWSPSPGEKVLIHNAEIIDVISGSTLHRRGILIQNGRISDVFTEKKAASVEADRIIDGGGMCVIPGLINGHCHMLLTSVLDFRPEVLAAMSRQIERNFEECITHGVTTVRDAGTMPYFMRGFIDRVEGGELMGPRVYSAGSAINVPGGYPDYIPQLPEVLTKKWGQPVNYVRTTQEARDAVKSNLEEGSSFIKLAFDDYSLLVGQKPIPVLDDEQLSAIVEEAHDQGVKVTAHHRFRRAFVRGTEFGLDGLEHLPGDEVLDDSEVEAFVAGGLYLFPTVQVGWALSGYSNDDPYLDNPDVQRSLASRMEAVRTIYPSLCEPPIYRALLRYEAKYRDPSCTERRHAMYTLDPRIFTKAIVVGMENLNKLYHAGALLGCGNDGGTPQNIPGILGLEMILLDIGTDMTPIDILRSATINNARILGVEEKLGSVEKGKLADLVLLAGNPLQNMETVLHPQAVFKEGKLVYSTHGGVSP
jgi:imidazolonepropionase-like amidohydrolase